MSDKEFKKAFWRHTQIRYNLKVINCQMTIAILDYLKLWLPPDLTTGTIFRAFQECYGSLYMYKELDFEGFENFLKEKIAKMIICHHGGTREDAIKYVRDRFISVPPTRDLYSLIEPHDIYTVLYYT